MRSPPRSDLSKNSPRDKSDEANPTESSEHPSSEMDQTVKALFEEEELLLGEHMQVRVSTNPFDSTCYDTSLITSFVFHAPSKGNSRECRAPYRGRPDTQRGTGRQSRHGGICS